MLDPIKQPYVTEPGGWIEWSYDRNEKRYVRFIRRWEKVLDANGKQVDIYAVYGRDPDEVLLDPEQLTYLIEWKREEE